jgi:hypothetical protein
VNLCSCGFQFWNKYRLNGIRNMRERNVSGGKDTRGMNEKDWSGNGRKKG